MRYYTEDELNFYMYLSDARVLTVEEFSELLLICRRFKIVGGGH